MLTPSWSQDEPVAYDTVMIDTAAWDGALNTYVFPDLREMDTAARSDYPFVKWDKNNYMFYTENSPNFQVFYEKDGLSVKATYAWRDSYLLGVGQSEGSSDAPPQFAKQFGQWDMSVNYDVSDNLTVFFEGINLNNETEQSYGRYERQFLSARQYGPRYILGARYSFE